MPRDRMIVIQTRIPEDYLKSTVEIDAITPKGPALGTGFFVSKDISRNGQHSRIYFLVTNKHMVSDWDILGEGTTLYKSLIIHYYTSNMQPATLSLDPTLADFSFLVYLHPNPMVDVVMIALCNEFVPTVAPGSFDVSCLMTFAGTNLSGLNGGDTNILALGTQAFALGYPQGITSANNHYPIAKAVWVSSLPGREFELNLFSRSGKMVDFKGKVYLLDGQTTGGNSGGPVVIPQYSAVRVSATNTTGICVENWIIGIFSQGGPASLGMAYSSDYILELINAFEKRVDSIDGIILHLH